MQRRFSPLFLVATLFIALHFSGCAQSAREAGVLHLVQKGDASTLDPARSYDTTSIPFVRVLYRGLVDYDDRANVINEVAQSHTVSPDGKTYAFRLRRDVYFHSGRRVVAEDFRYALERVLDPATASDGLTLFNMIDGAKEWSAYCEKVKPQQRSRHIRGIEVRGQDEIIFHLNQADATFLNYLALPFAYAVPRESVEKWGERFGENPDGCGPFRMVEWVHDGWLKLEANPRYFRRDLPRVKRVEVLFGQADELQIMRFEQGQIDVLPISNATPPDFLRVKNNARWQPLIQHAPMMDVRYVCFNTELKPFTDVRVRRAFNHAINRSRIVSFLTGRATLAKGVLPPGMPAFNSQLRGYDYDPKRARALLKEAGYAGNFPNLTLWYSNNESWYEKAAQAIQADLKAIGVTIQIKGVAYSELKAKAGQRRGIEMSMIGWVQDFPDPSNFFDPLLNGKSISEKSSVNRSFYSDARINTLLDKAIVERNRAKRLAMYQAAEKQIVADAPWVFLHHTERYVVQQPWVKGYTLHPMWSERYEYVSVDR